LLRVEVKRYLNMLKYPNLTQTVKRNTVILRIFLRKKIKNVRIYR
jgi:hypothetical protein